MSNMTMLPSGDLLVTLWEPGETPTEEDRDDWKAMMQRPAGEYDLLEDTTCNSDFELIDPDYQVLYLDNFDILTSSPLIAYDVRRVGDTDENDNPLVGNPEARQGDIIHVTHLWWFPDYMVEDPWETLLTNGYVIFTNGNYEERKEIINEQEAIDHKYGHPRWGLDRWNRCRICRGEGENDAE